MPGSKLLNILQLNSERFKIQFISILLIIFLSACSEKPDDPKNQIKTVIDEVEIAAEKRSVTLINQHIWKDYKDKHHIDRQRLMGSLLGYFHRNKHIHLFTRIRNIEISEQNNLQANASVNVAMTGTQVDSAQKLLMLKANVFRFNIDLENIDDQWMITGAKWRVIDVKDFLD